MREGGQPPEAAEPYLDSKHRRGGRGSSCTRGAAGRALSVDEEGARLSRRRSLESADVKKKKKEKEDVKKKKSEVSRCSLTETWRRVELLRTVRGCNGGGGRHTGVFSSC